MQVVSQVHTETHCIVSCRQFSLYSILRSKKIRAMFCPLHRVFSLATSVHEFHMLLTFLIVGYTRFTLVYSGEEFDQQQCCTEKVFSG